MFDTIKNQKVPAFLLFLLFAFFMQSCNLFQEDNNQEREDPYNGVRKNYNKEGRLISAITYKDSLRHGLARNYYANGKVQAEFNYLRGYKHGEEKVYYENGDIYMITHYENGKKNGTQKKFYSENRLMAEIPYENNNVIPGLKEYNKSGKLKRNDTKIDFKLIDKTAFENKFELRMQLSDGSKVANFERYYVDEEGELLGSKMLVSNNGVAKIDFFLAPGKSLLDEIYIMAQRKTSLGNPEIIKDSYHLVISNKKKFY
jgi:hypothetical protein